MSAIYKERVVPRTDLGVFVARLDPTIDIIVAVAPYRVSESGYVLEYVVVWKHAPA